jgi:hypothetical protein
VACGQGAVQLKELWAEGRARYKLDYKGQKMWNKSNKVVVGALIAAAVWQAGRGGAGLLRGSKGSTTIPTLNPRVQTQKPNHKVERFWFLICKCP